jgi:hypothetical protein
MLLDRDRHRQPTLLAVVVFFFIIIGWMSTGTDSLAAATNGSGSSGGPPADRSTSTGDDNETPKLLPPPTGDRDPSIPSIKLGETIKFEQYGPIILNSDGTTRRMYVKKAKYIARS